MHITIKPSRFFIFLHLLNQQQNATNITNISCRIPGWWTSSGHSSSKFLDHERGRQFKTKYLLRNSITSERGNVTRPAGQDRMSSVWHIIVSKIPNLYKLPEQNAKIMTMMITHHNFQAFKGLNLEAKTCSIYHPNTSREILAKITNHYNLLLNIIILYILRLIWISFVAAFSIP